MATKGLIVGVQIRSAGTLLILTSIIVFHLIVTGTSIVDPLHFGVYPDPDLDPRIHASDYWIQIRIRILLFSLLTFPRCQQKTIFLKFFCLLLFEGTYLYIIFRDKKSKRSHAVGIKVLTFFAW
jgi:hypothetical protein